MISYNDFYNLCFSDVDMASSIKEILNKEYPDYGFSVKFDNINYILVIVIFGYKRFDISLKDKLQTQDIFVMSMYNGLSEIDQYLLKNKIEKFLK